jgi:catechol 2,3-dioxygenase-like lactoylglutathione lyase family enzyme
MSAVPAAVPIHGLHHFAYRCRDAEETRRFYEDVLGLPLWHIIQSDHVPSTGEFCPYTHIFFRLTDGSCVAFFDLGDDVACAPSPNTPPWVNHLALRVDTVAELEQIKARLQAHGVEVLGVTDHHIFKSIYFFDPNGIRLELAAQLASEQRMLEESRSAHERLAEWTRRKDAWRRERAEGGGPAVLEPQQNDRPEVAARAAKAGR